MANHKSAEKRIRQTERRTAVNRARVSRIRTFVKKVETAIATGDKTAAAEAFKEAQPEMQRGVQGCPSPEHRFAQAVAAFFPHQGALSLLAVRSSCADVGAAFLFPS